MLTSLEREGTLEGSQRRLGLLAEVAAGPGVEGDGHSSDGERAEIAVVGAVCRGALALDAEHVAAGLEALAQRLGSV